MAEDPAQHDSGDEWLVELLSLPSSSLTRRQHQSLEMQPTLQLAPPLELSPLRYQSKTTA